MNVEMSVFIYFCTSKSKLFQLVGETRPGGTALKGRHFRTEMRGNFFSQSGGSVEFIATESSGGQVVECI